MRQALGGKRGGVPAIRRLRRAAMSTAAAAIFCIFAPAVIVWRLSLWAMRLPPRAWLSLPAILALGAAAAAAAWVAEAPADRMLIYRRAADEALARGALEAADIYYRKLIAVEEYDAEGRYGRGLVAQRRGHIERATAIMHHIAPLDRPGYAPAHFWLAEQLLDSMRGTEATARLERLKAAEQHLRWVLHQQPKRVEAHRMLGQLYATTGRHQQAIQHLSHVVERYPEWRLTLAQLHALLGQRAPAEIHGRAARDYFLARFQRDPGTPDAAIDLARAELFLGHFERGIELLQQLETRTHDPRCHAELAAAYVNWSDRTRPSELGRRLERLAKALEHAPGYEPAVLRFQAFVGRKEPQAEQARKLLEGLAAKGPASAAVHLILAAMAVSAGDLNTARTHMETAYRADPQAPLVANNLAWLLAQADPPALAQALELIHAAIERLPEQPEFRETRGQILAKLGRYKEAIPDLESSLRSLANRPEIHETLAKAYAQIGDAELAEKHRRLAAPGKQPAPKLP